ncbi:MAG: GNAT family N-acetyltransferase, partial [Clostridiales bacterium]|nr:GNAT family N-acetyltransferase [Clostridiales bacterium]
MTFRKAILDDLDRISEIYDEIHTKIEEGEYTTGWVRSIYPTRKSAEDSINKGDMFVEEDYGLIVAAGKLNQEQVDAYADAEWSEDVPDDKVMVLHTLVVSP